LFYAFSITILIGNFFRAIEAAITAITVAIAASAYGLRMNGVSFIGVISPPTAYFSSLDTI